MYNIEENRKFQAQLKTDFCYRTPAGPARRLGPFEWMRAVAFHYRILRVYFVAWKMIKRGQFDLEGYAARSCKSLLETEVSGGRFEISGLGALTRVKGPVVIDGNHMGS